MTGYAGAPGNTRIKFINSKVLAHSVGHCTERGRDRPEAERPYSPIRTASCAVALAANPIRRPSKKMGKYTDSGASQSPPLLHVYARKGATRPTRTLMTMASLTPPASPRPDTPARLALESTLLLHGVPRENALPLARELAALAATHGAHAVLLGLRHGRFSGGLSDADLNALLADRDIPKLNTASLGAAVAQGANGATTVSTTMELAAAAGIRVFATGGLGGVHKRLDQRLDISTDLFAFTRFPVAVVTAGCKSILDVLNTRELLETLGVPVIGFRCDRFPAFYRRDGGAGVDARFDDVQELARFVRREMARTRRGVVVCNPIPAEHELPEARWAEWLEAAEQQALESGATGRAVTPAVLSALHSISGGKTLTANIELVKHNVGIGAQLAAAIGI